VPRRTSTAPGPTRISLPALGPGGRSLFGAWEGGTMPDSAREPAGGIFYRAPPGSRDAGDGQVSSGETPWPRSFGLKSPDR